jgi:hypothetical protein
MIFRPIKFYPMKTKHLKRIASEGIMAIVFTVVALTFGQVDLTAQKSSEISQQTLQELQHLVSDQKALLAKEIELNSSDVNLVAINKILMQYFGSAINSFRNDDVNIQEAFAWNLAAIVPPRNENSMTNRLFTGSAESRVADEGNLSHVNPAFRMANTDFQQAITSIDISDGDLDSIEDFIDFINSNRQ